MGTHSHAGRAESLQGSGSQHEFDKARANHGARPAPSAVLETRTTLAPKSAPPANPKSGADRDPRA